MPTDTRRSRGLWGEELARRHLLATGYSILETNYRTRYGELDVIARSERALVFCEVKTLVEGTLAGPARPLDAIGPRKRRQLRLMAAQWLAARASDVRPGASDLRFDAIGVTLTRGGDVARLEHLEDAF